MSIDDLRKTFASGITADLGWRATQLDAILAMLTEAAPALLAALAEDLGKHPTEATNTDILPSILEAQLAREQLETWAADRPADVATSGSPLALSCGPNRSASSSSSVPGIFRSSWSSSRSSPRSPPGTPPSSSRPNWLRRRAPCWPANSPLGWTRGRSKCAKAAPTSPRRFSLSASITSCTRARQPSAGSSPKPPRST